jgi:diaminopropionate ammonia-lyase
MHNPLSPCPISIFKNPAVRNKAAGDAAFLTADGYEKALREISSWPGYQPTPLIPLPGLARAAGLGAIWYKDEGGRFGLGSFKALGGAYAISRHLIDTIRDTTGETATTADLIEGKYGAQTSKITVTSATDGNHGRSVAWGAKMFGCQCVIYIHATVSEGRKLTIENFGATVVRIDGNYDDSVRQAASDAVKFNRQVISDTSYDGYMETPKHVMYGYGVMASEVVEQLSGERPTHVFIQGGCGGFAAAVFAYLQQCWDEDRPQFIFVEPEAAASIYASAQQGEAVVIPGDLNTIMAGLACGEASLLAWQYLSHNADAFISIPDQSAEETMRLLAKGVDGDPPLVAGESAVAGLAAALAARLDPVQLDLLGLTEGSRILVFGTEGATDPDVYQHIVGKTADQVRRGES